jgi:PAS domain S-box-containing protein
MEINTSVDFTHESNGETRMGQQPENISELEKHISQLEQQTRIFRTVLSSITDFAYIFDRDGRFIYSNQPLLNLLGITLEEIIGKNFFDLNYPEDLAARLQKQIQQVFETKEIVKDETPFTSPTDKSGFYEYIFTPVFAGDGTVELVAGSTRDITVRKKAEESIRFQALLLNTVEQAVIATDLNGKIIYWNQFAEKLYGWSAEDAVGHNVAELTTPEMMAEQAADIMSQLRNGKSWSGEFTVQRRDGTTFPAEICDSPINDSQGRLIGIIGISQDITKRKRVEEELHKSDARLRLALDISQTSTFEIDLLTDAVETDEIGREIYGFEKNEPLTFTKVQSRFHPDDLEEVLRSVSAALAPEGTDEFEVEQRVIRTDGKTRWIRVRGRAFFEGEGEMRRPINCIGTYIDITERKQAEQERERLLKQLEAERSRLQYLFTKAPAFVATVYGADHVFELTNPAYLQLIGHRDVIGKPVREALPEVEGQGFFELLDNVFQTGEAFTGRELPIQLQREPEGPLEQRFVDFVYQPIFEADRSISGIFAHGVDITEQVRARKDAEDANRAKDEFLATLSHELRTPLNAILGWSRMLSDAKLDEEIRARGLETIQRNTLLQSQLIDDILDVSRIISGKLRLEVRPVELSSVVESAIESILPAAQAKEIRLQSVLDSHNCLISGDVNRLQQVIWNLLSNAIKFTPKGGRVQVRLERVNSHVEIIVTDTGMGIPPEVLPHVFERFRQADSATTRKHGGLGLGLAIVRHLVEMHGGTVQVESHGEGKGATFTVKLPLIALRSAETLPEKSNERKHPTAEEGLVFDCAPELEGLHVLIVDDDPDGRVLVTTVLEQCGAKVSAVGSASEALSALQKLRPDVLISDIGMPGEDGYSLISKVRALPAEKGGKTPAAALTAYARAEDRLRILRSGFQIHLPKPVEPSELIAVVENLIGRIGVS